MTQALYAHMNNERKKIKKNTAIEFISSVYILPHV
jgi:hypothetical protein